VLEEIAKLPPLHLCESYARKKIRHYNGSSSVKDASQDKASATSSLLAHPANSRKKKDEEEEQQEEEEEEEDHQHRQNEEEEEEGLHQQDELRLIGFFPLHEPPHLRRPQHPYYQQHHPYSQRIDNHGTIHIAF